MVSLRIDGHPFDRRDPQNPFIRTIAGDYYHETSRQCIQFHISNLPRFIWYVFLSYNSTNHKDRSVEEFHAYWRDLVREGAIKNVFDFERVFGEFKRQKGLL
jgi:hypothetical protein